MFKNMFIFSLLLLTKLGYSQELKNSFTDTLFSKQWAIKNIGQTIFLQDSDLTRQKVVGIPGIDINFLDTSLMSSPKSEIIVAVLDSGIDLNHPDLKSRIWYNQSLCNNAPNAKNLPCNGFNFLENNTSLLDDIGHGTHVAGIIAANRNGIGIVGAGDPRIKIMPLKVLNNSVNSFVYNGKLITDVIADAMVFAIKNGAEVINLSLGWPKLIDTPKVRAAFQLAEDQNVIVVAAAGNNNKDLPTFPCSYESVICVGAIDNQNKLTDFTNHGSKVDIVAPGEYIVSTYPTTLESRVLRIKNYEVKRGSSQAAPFVTASIANLKLLNPGINNDQVRNLLFRSAKKIAENSKHFTKYGALDQKRLIELSSEAPQSVVAPLLKNITEVKFNYLDKKFNFLLPIKNYSNFIVNEQICINSLSDSIVLDNECFDVSMKDACQIINLKISGSLLNLNADSQINFKIKTSFDNFLVSVFFTRDLNFDPQIKSSKIVGGNFDDMGIISNGRRLSKMQKVIDRHSVNNFTEYFFTEKAKQTESQTTVSILTKGMDGFYVKTITIPKQNKIISIHRKDINLDGKLDYMIYTLSNDKKMLKLFFFNDDTTLLFGKNSEWNWPISTFEGLPVDNNVENFSWLRLKTELGNILVPSINKSFDMPEVDNSKNILDRIVVPSIHQYYLQPVLTKDGVSINLRALDSVAKMKQFRVNFNLDSSYRFELLKMLPSYLELENQGKISVLAKSFNNDETKYYELIMDETSIQATVLDVKMPIESSTIYSIFDLNESKISKENIFTSLINRSRANLILKNETEMSYPNDVINSWENPILSLIATFKSDKSHYFIMENRNTISFSDESGNFKYELPIYRDSSFPGQNFSETLYPITSGNNAGVFVNSTLIFGERLYSMIGSENGFIRPMKSSVNIPDGCIPLPPELDKTIKDSNYVFLCTDPSKQLSLKFLPMSQN